MTVEELRLILNTLCVDKSCNKYSICISNGEVLIDTVALVLDDDRKIVLLEKK